MDKKADVPSEFPPARLFLDDIEEIVRVLWKAIESQETNHTTVEDLKMKVRFSVGGQECDEIQDLPKIASGIRPLEIRVGRGRGTATLIIIRPWFGVTWVTWDLTEEAWSIFPKLQAVFQKRKRRWTILLHSLPGWLSWSLPNVVLWFGVYLSFPPYKLIQRNISIAIARGLLGATIAAVITGARHTILTFRHSWDSSPFGNTSRTSLFR